tara:strand:- start:379 stop:1407 length:1029 start_codon:yes stop_codon:yes gene_type:complete
MADFDAQIQDLVGTGFTDQTAMDTWMTDGVKEVINSMPPSMLELCSSVQSFTSTKVGSESETLSTAKISGVTLDGEPCRLIPAVLKNKVSSVDDMDYATLTDPVYYIEGNKINALPSVGTCKYSEVQYTSVNASEDDAIANFPDEAEYLVVLYASIKALQQQMNSKSASLPNDLSITTSLPDVPSISSHSVEDFSGFDPSYTIPDVILDFAQVDSYIDTDEDTELAGAKLQEIQQQLAAHGANIQNELNKFNEESSIYQANIQKKIQEAELADSNEAKKIQKYSAELQSYQAEVESEVQEYNGIIQKHVTDYQWLQSQHQQLNYDYMRGLQLLKSGTLPQQQ